MAQEIRSSVITTSLLKKYKNKPIQSSVALRACFYRSIVSCSETPRATFHLFFSRGCLLLQLLLLCHPKPLFGFRKSEVFKWGVTAASCLARLLSLSGFGAVPVFGITLRGASCPKKVSKHLNSTFHLTLKKSSVSLFFCLHCIASKKTPTLVKHYTLRIQKTGNAPRVLRHRGCNLSASQPLVAPPFVPLADGSRSPCLALS